MSKIIVLGAGVCGLAGGMLLAGDGHEVTVLERDAAPAPETPQQAWADWDRGGVGQFRQAHFLLPAGRAVLDQELPHVARALAGAGAARVDLLAALPPTLTDRSPRPDDDRFTTLTARRPVLEQMFARCAADTGGLQIRRGVAVTGLVTQRRDGLVQVTGARLQGGEHLPADLVVDAMGRRSPMPAWLAQAGCRPVPEAAEESGFTYYSRFFRSPDGRLPEVRAPLLSELDCYSLLTLPADNASWSVTVYLSSGDQPLKRLRDPECWTRLLAACPLHAHWLDGQPLTGVQPMAGVLDRRRRLVLDGQPVVTGVALLADAWACTNPSQGRGITLGLRHARLLRDVVRTHLDDPAKFATAWDEATETELTPWYRDTVTTDRARIHTMQAAARGAPPLPPPPPVAALLGAMTGDADLFRAFLEVQSGLSTLVEVLSRPGLLDHAAALGGEPVAVPAPDRRQLLQLLG